MDGMIISISRPPDLHQCVAQCVAYLALKWDMPAPDGATGVSLCLGKATRIVEF